MVELLNALGARLHSDPLFCFWIRYEAPTADRVSNGAPWLGQPKPASTMPNTVMPCQVSWQLVVMKSVGSVQRRGFESVSIGGGIVLFLIGIRMVFPPVEGGVFGKQGEGEPFMVPVRPADARPRAGETDRVREPVLHGRRHFADRGDRPQAPYEPGGRCR